MSSPVVLLWLADDPVAHALHATLLDHVPRLHVRRCQEASEVIDACATELVSLLLLSHRVDDTGGAKLLRELGAFGPIPQSIVLFDDAADPRRPIVAQAGALDHVLPSTPGTVGRELSPLAALIDRVILKDALEARLDQASRQFKLLVDNSNDGIYILREGRFIYSNRRFQQMIGFGVDEVLAEDFDINERLIAPESRHILVERQRRVAAGVPVEPRYEFVAMRKNGEKFHAQVSISYIELDGPALTKVGGALGIVQDITERKGFETQIVRKNRELELLNDVSASINRAVALDETLAQGCRRMGSLLGASATGISLLSPDTRSLVLRFSDGLDETLAKALGTVALDSTSLLAAAVKHGSSMVVADVAQDPRVAIDLVKASRFQGCIVVPLLTGAQEHGAARVLGAAFAFLAPGRAITRDDREVMESFGVLLGNAVEKAALLESERMAVKKLVALDEIAVALASTLDINDVAQTVARNIHKLFGAKRVLIAQLDESSSGEASACFRPLHALDDGKPTSVEPIRASDTIMGLCLREGRPVQRVRPSGTAASVDPFTGQPVRLLPYEEDVFNAGIGAGVAVPVVQDGRAVGALWIGYAMAEPLSVHDLGVLSSIGMHVAIALKNANLFSARNQALDDLRAAQDKLVESEKLQAIGLIAHGVAHDFNNMLGSILGRAQLLKSQLREPALIKHADVIEKAAVDGAETVRRIQEIGRQDRIDDFVPVDLNQIIEDVIELTQPRWRDLPLSEGRPIDIAVQRAEKPPVVAGNPHQLRELLVNLVHNAVDAMPQGGRIELATAHRSAGDVDVCELRLRDTGTGMPDEVKHKIFDPYFTTKGERGTGLGLSVSLSIVRRHGGDMEVFSSMSGPERGTTFVVTLQRHDAPVHTPQPATPAERTGKNARVLVVDDEENIREILAEILQNGGHEVVTAADGPEALTRLQESGTFDLVFTDLGLPGMNGYEVAGAIKKIQPNLPVGLVTGWGATLDAEKARAHGVDLVISKPFRFEQVLGLVDEALLTQSSRR